MMQIALPMFSSLTTFLALLIPIKCFILTTNPGGRRGFKTAVVKKGLGEWSEDDLLAGLRENKVLERKFVDDLDDKISNTISAFAMNTVGYYMVEFRDEVSEKWMMGFMNYRQDGFPDGKWTDFIEQMISTDKVQVEVYMQCSRSVLRARQIPDGANVAMMYHVDVEPRKIAHKILTVREDVCNEMIEDLGCVTTENVEIIRFANVWATEGRVAAEKSRRLTRLRSQGGGTPLRDKNYMDMDIMITELALQLVRDDLRKSNDKSALAVLESLEDKMRQDDEARSILDRMLNDADGPRQFLEELYYKGVTEGAGMKRPDGSKSTVNVLKVAESIIDMRYAITKEASKLLSSQNLNHRYYYKLIKDLGGFQKFDLSRKPKFQLIDLDKRDDANGGVLDANGSDGYQVTTGGFRSAPMNSEGTTTGGGGAGGADVKQPSSLTKEEPIVEEAVISDASSSSPPSSSPPSTTPTTTEVTPAVLPVQEEEEYIDYDKPFGSDGPMMM